MKDTTEQTTTPLWVKAAESPWVKGPVLGAGVMVLVTPFLKWTNHAYKGEKMPRGNYFSGAGSYALSAVPGYATTFVVKALLGKKSEETSQGYELFSSFTAGGFSGLVCTPSEALAQNKQLTKSTSSLTTAQQMRTHHGYSSFFRGAVSVGTKEGLWATVYLTEIPEVSSALQKQGVEKHYAMPFATLMVAGAYGWVSSPLNQLRYLKQEGLTAPGANKSYFEHAANMWRNNTFFKGSGARAVATTVGAALMVKGMEYYNQAVEYFKR